MIDKTYDVGIYCRLSNDDEGNPSALKTRNFFSKITCVSAAGTKLTCTLMTDIPVQTSTGPA